MLSMQWWLTVVGAKRATCRGATYRRPTTNNLSLADRSFSMVGIRLDDADFRGTIGANGNVACVQDAKQSLQHEHSGAHDVCFATRPNTVAATGSG